jgi:flagellar export protein FliJ
MALGERIAQIRAGILMHKAEIRSRLAELRQLPPDERPAKQQVFLQFVHVLDTRIRQMEQTAAGLEEQRKQKIKELLEVRKNQKSLENLRERAKEAYHQEQEQAQQKETDETSSTAYARKILLPSLEQI